MAWVLVTGRDVDFFHDALQKLPPSGYEVVAAPEGTTALQLLTDIAPARDMLVLLRREMGQLDVADFLSAATVDDVLRRRHAYLLLDDAPGGLPDDVERYLDRVSVPVLRTPADASDADAWEDLLDALDLAARQLPTSRTTP